MRDKGLNEIDAGFGVIRGNEADQLRCDFYIRTIPGAIEAGVASSSLAPKIGKRKNPRILKGARDTVETTGDTRAPVCDRGSGGGGYAEKLRDCVLRWKPA